MTLYRLTYEMHARPKSKKLDDFMDTLNKNMKDFGMEETVHYNAPLGNFAFNLEDDDKFEENKKKILDTAKEVIEEKYFSDITFKLVSKKEVKDDDGSK